MVPDGADRETGSGDDEAFVIRERILVETWSTGVMVKQSNLVPPSALPESWSLLLACKLKTRSGRENKLFFLHPNSNVPPLLPVIETSYCREGPQLGRQGRASRSGLDSLSRFYLDSLSQTELRGRGEHGSHV